MFATYDSYGRYWHELFRLPRDARQSLEPRFDADGFEHVAEPIGAGTGVILALPHVGGWEFAGAWLAARGYPPTVVVERVDPPALFEWFVAVRRTLGMDVVALGPDAGPAVEAVAAAHARDGGRAARVFSGSSPGAMSFTVLRFKR